MDDDKFEKIVADAIDSIPEKYGKGLDNVAFVVQDEPTIEQRKKLKLRCNALLFGLYEGVPKTVPHRNFSGKLPDKITIFKNPILIVSQTEDDVVAKVKRTVWHEVAHHYGLGHDEIHSLEQQVI